MSWNLSEAETVEVQQTKSIIGLIVLVLFFVAALSFSLGLLVGYLWAL